MCIHAKDHGPEGYNNVVHAAVGYLLPAGSFREEGPTKAGCLYKQVHVRRDLLFGPIKKLTRHSS